MSQLDLIVDSQILQKLSKSRYHANECNYEHFDPINSTYRCYTCQKPKMQKKSIEIITNKKKKKKLQMCQLHDIIIKPWHPFLREMQRFFKFSNKTSEQSNAIVYLYETIRKLRAQLFDDMQKMQEQGLATQPIIDILSLYSIDEIESQYKDPKNQTHSSLRFQILEKRVQSYKQQIADLQETIQILEGHQSDKIKTSIPIISKLKKEVEVLKIEIMQLNEQIDLMNRELVQLNEENNYLHNLVKHERLKLYQQIVQLYPQEQIYETQISYFDLYLSKQEEEYTKLKLAKIKLQASAERISQQSEEYKSHSQLQITQEIKSNEEKLQGERLIMQEHIETLRIELNSTKKAENDLKNICKNQDLRIEQLRKELFDCQNQMNLVSQSNLQLRNQIQAQINQIDDLRNTITNLEYHAQQKDNMIKGTPAEELALIILSKDPPKQQQVDILKSSVQVFENDYDSQQSDPTEKIMEQLNDLRSIKERIEKQSQAQSIQLQQIKYEIEQAYQDDLSQSTKSEGKLRPQQATPTRSCIERISKIVNNQDEYVRANRFKSNSPFAQQSSNDLQHMLLLQCITIQELIDSRMEDDENHMEEPSDFQNRNYDENFSDQEHEKEGILANTRRRREQLWFRPR
ncbi:hypothetical protein pb186bvf_001018 [Paramecium bursaria]